MINRIQKIFVDRDELNQSIGDIEFARSLEQTTIDFNNVDNNGRNLLHRAALQQNPKLIREILTEYSKLQLPMHAYINLNDKFGINAVQMCCFANYNERAPCLELFIEDGDLNSFNPRTLWAPAHWVAFYGDIESMQLLISKEAILFRTDYEGYYPLDLAGRNNKKFVATLIIDFLIQFLIDYEKSRVSQRVKNLVYDRFCEYERYISNPALRLSLFYWSCHFRLTNLERFTALNRFYPLAIYLDSTALHNSIRNSNMEAFLFLLHSSQIKPFTQGMLLSRNATPQNNRIFSMKKEEQKIYKKRYQQYLVRLDEWEYDYLNNQISLLDQVDQFGNTPLHIAALSNNTEIINYLIQYGCRIDIQNSEYWTPVDLSHSVEVRSIFRENEKLKLKSIKNIQNFLFTCKLPTQKYDPVHKRNLYLCQAIKEIEVDNLFSISQDLIVPDFVIKCSAQHITKLNFQIQVLINAKFEVYLAKSEIDNFYYIMLRSPLNQLQIQAMIQKVQVKLLDSYDYEPYDSNGHFEPFRSLQRQSIIEEHLNRILNIQELIQQKVIIDTYRMHSFGGTTKIRRQWLEQQKWYHTQPFKQLQDYFREGQNQNFKSCSILRLYFGEQIAYFFAFKSYLTCFMIFAAFPGLILQIYILAINNFNSLVLPLYAIYMSIWSTITVEFWKRKQCEMNARWGLLDQMNQQELTTRLEFQGDEYMNHITHQIEKYEQQGHSTIMFMISIPVLILFSSFIVGLFVTIDYIQQTYTNSSYYKLLVGVLQGICVSVLNIIYTALVHYFVEKENHKYEEHYESSLIYKNVLFKFINSYIAVFYTAFIKLNSTYEEIFYILVPVLVIKQLSYLIAIMMIPQIIYKYKESSYFQLFKQRQNLRQYLDPIDLLWKETTNVPLKSQSRVVMNLTTQQIQQNIDMDSVELNGLKLPAYKYLMTNYFMDTMIDFGFITLFTAAFPIGPTIAMIMNIIEIRMKVYSFNSVFKRPQAQRVAGIGDWMYIWEFLSFIGVFTNYALVFLKQGDQINNYLFPDGSVTRTNILWLFLLFVFLNVILKYVIQWIIPDKPTWVSEWEEDLKNKKKQNSELKQKEDECQQLNNRINRLEKQNNKLIQRLNIEQNLNSITIANESLLQQTISNDSGSYLTLYYKMERDIALEKLNQIQKLLKQKKQLLIVCAECQINEAVVLCQQCKIHYCKICYIDLCKQHKIEQIQKGYFKMFYYSFPLVNQQGLKHLFDILCTYYENKSYGTKLYIGFEDFCVDDKFMINKLHSLLYKKSKIQWEEFSKYVQQLQKGTFEQRILLMYDFMDEDKQGMISRDEFQNYAVYHMRDLSNVLRDGRQERVDSTNNLISTTFTTDQRIFECFTINMIIIDFLYIVGIGGVSLGEYFFHLQRSYQVYTMLSSLVVLSLWFGLRLKKRQFKNDQIELLGLLLVGNTLRTIASTHISEMYFALFPKRLLYIIPIQNHQHPKKMFLCVPFIAIVVSVKLEFSYEHAIVGYAFILLIWLSINHPVEKAPQVSKNHSYSRTWLNPSDSLIINQNDKYDLVVTRQGKMISQTSEHRKLLGTDDPILIQQILSDITIHKLDNQYKKYKIDTLLQLIENTDLIKCKVLDCSTPFGDNYMIELKIINENVALNFYDTYELKDYWERKVTKQLMNQLFRSLSHEFSTSLNCIRLLAENAIEDIEDDLTVNTYFQPILNSSYILNSIVQDVRDFSLILSKNFVLTIQIQNIQLLIHEVAELYRQQLNMKGVQLIVKMNEFQIHTDGQRFKQVLNNLLSNAQKFTFSGSVTIDVQEQSVNDQQFIKISVQDTGSGMDLDTQTRLQEFLKQPHQRKSNLNYGLGLMISNTICNGLSPNYESGIHFLSNNKTGSIFWFFIEDLKTMDLPDAVSRRTIKYNKIHSSGRSFLEQSFLISPSDKKRQSSFTFSLKGKQKLIEKHSENLSEPDDVICAPYIFREGPKKPQKYKYPQIDQVVSEYAEEKSKILIVDDEFVNIYALTTMFSRLDLKCDSAHNGKEGLDKFKQQHYQVILMDIEMPIMNGIQATQHIIEFCHSADIDPPIIIAQTAYTDMQTKQMCKEVGMDYFLQKPISTIEIKQILQTIQLTL